jgi:O-antigen ligase
VAVLLALESVGIVVFEDNLVRVAGRAAGFYANANQAGQAVVFGLALSIFAIPRKLRLPLILLGAVGVAATFSRSAMIGLVVVVVLLAWNREIAFWEPLLAVLVIAVVLTVASGALLRILDTAGTLNPDTWGRLTFSADDSGRAAVLRATWQLFLDSPVLGSGVAIEKVRFPISSHNIYATLAADHGILGLLLFPLLAAALAWRNRRALPFVAVLVVTGFFSHNLLEEECSMIAIALAAATAFPSPDEEGSENEAALSEVPG